MLMVPPEHRRELTPLLNKISDLLLQEALKIPGQ